MSFRWDLAVLIGLLAIADSQNIWLPDFRRLSWPSSAVSNDGRWLYIDSGELSNGTDLASNLNILRSTYVFDLHQSWTNATVNPSITIPKPDHFPFAKAPYFWYSAEDQSLYSWAGSYFDTFTCQHLCPTWSFREDDPLGLFGFPVKPDFNVLWKLQTNDGSLQGGGTWVPAPDRLQPPSGYVPTSVGLWTSVDSTLWSFGGSFTEVPTWNGNSYDRSPWTTPGIVTFSPPGVAPIGGWTNTTESFHAVAGRAISAPSFGSSGAIVLLDSVLSVGSEGDALSTETAADMSQIRIYDIKSGLIFDQTATGDIPQPRRYFCAAGVSDSAGHFDIFFYGGGGPDASMLSDPEGYIRSVNTVYILSIPSFHWHAVQGDVADIYQNARATQTCNLAGQRQVVVVGGDLSYINAGRTTDAWTNGIAVYDMAALQWSDRYDANAEPYQRSPDLQKAQEGRVYPNTWDSPELEAIFRLPSQDEDKGLSTGAIAGIAVGAVVVIIAITGGFCLCLWRRRRRHRYESAKTGPHTPPDGRINDREGKAELPESRHYTTELDGRARHELE